MHLSAEMAFQAEAFGMKFLHVFQAEIFGKISPCQNSKPKFHAEIPSQNILKLSKTEFAIILAWDLGMIFWPEIQYREVLFSLSRNAVVHASRLVYEKSYLLTIGRRFGTA